jgi:hypothetical protein
MTKINIKTSPFHLHCSKGMEKINIVPKVLIFAYLILIILSFYSLIINFIFIMF